MEYRFVLEMLGKEAMPSPARKRIGRTPRLVVFGVCCLLVLLVATNFGPIPLAIRSQTRPATGGVHGPQSVQDLAIHGGWTESAPANLESVSRGSPAIGPTVESYNVTLREHGLLAGTIWFATIAGVGENGSSGFAVAPQNIVFNVTAGNYSLGIQPVAGYTLQVDPIKVTVSNADVTKLATFFAVSPPPEYYNVTFNETGLATGTGWSVSVNGTTVYASAPAGLLFRETNGTHTYGVTPVIGYGLASETGNVIVNGASVQQSVIFTPNPPPAPPPMFEVTFQQAGLPAGKTWSVSFAGLTNFSTGSTLDFLVTNGSYSFGLPTVTGYTSSPTVGSLLVNGSAVIEFVRFTEINQILGLPPLAAYLLIGLLGLDLVGVVLAAALWLRRRGPAGPGDVNRTPPPTVTGTPSPTATSTPPPAPPQDPPAG